MVKKQAKFFLNDPKATVDTHIFLYFTCQEGNLKYSTQQKVLSSNWDTKSQRVIEDKKQKDLYKTAREINTELNRLESIVSQFQESCRILGKPVYREELKRELNQKTHKEKVVNELSFFSGVEIILSDAESGKLLTKEGKRYTPGTIKNLNKSKDRLQEFDPHMTFEGITLETYNNFITWCNNRNYSLNYTGKIIKDWIRFLNVSLSRKWHKNNISNDPEFKKISEEVYKIYLNEAEIDLIKNVDLSKLSREWEIVRDRFIINLYNGLRISDMKTFTDSHIQNNTIVHTNQKTGKTVVIPVHPVVEEIIAKNNGIMPKQYNDVMVNAYIKLIAKKAGLTETIRWTKTEGGVKKEFTAKKWELVTCHTGRRSFVTNMLKHVDVVSAMPVTGMSLKTIMLYNKRSSQENAEMLKENPFFKKK